MSPGCGAGVKGVNTSSASRPFSAPRCQKRSAFRAAGYTGYALETVGRLKFSTAGIATIPAGSTSKVITSFLLTAGSFLLLTPGVDIGTRRLWFTKNVAAHTITIHLSSSRDRHQGLLAAAGVGAADGRNCASDGSQSRLKRQRITIGIPGRLLTLKALRSASRLGKQTLCQLSYSRSGAVRVHHMAARTG